MAKTFEESWKEATADRLGPNRDLGKSIAEQCWHARDADFSALQRELEDEKSCGFSMSAELESLRPREEWLEAENKRLEQQLLEMTAERNKCKLGFEAKGRHYHGCVEERDEALKEISTIEQQLREAEAACAEMRLAIEGIDEWEWHECTDPDRICPWCGSTERFGHLTECQRQKALAINPGALLLARLQAADELTKYLEHNEGCALPNSYHEDRPDSCSCGLGELLKKIQKLREAK